jgi:hypothetical protein
MPFTVIIVDYENHTKRVKESSCQNSYWLNVKVELETQDYRVFWTFPSSGILDTIKHDVSETGSVSVLR